MPSVIKTVTFDAADALALAGFWAAVFGSDVEEESTAEKAFLEAAGWGGPNIWFVRVPEGKTAKNRMHFDLRAPGPAAEEVARLENLGARVLERHEHHVLMADPEGNEFCVEPGLAGWAVLTTGRTRPTRPRPATPARRPSGRGPQYEHAPAEITAPVGQVRPARAVEILTHPGRVRVTGVLGPATRPRSTTERPCSGPSCARRPAPSPRARARRPRSGPGCLPAR